ncbi:MAG: hypothetical protein HC807_05120, partial [Gammaproteobacteria bacterium]|nr:hypothetical protein [Gammaproteobacteria bacterium]
ATAPAPLPGQHRPGAADGAAVALAGPFSNLALAAVFALLFVFSVWGGVIPPIAIADPYLAAGERLFYPTLNFFKAESVVAIVLGLGVFLNLVLAVFNLIPLPPLDGSRVVGWILPHPLAVAWYRLDRIGIFLILGLFFLATRSPEAYSVFFDQVLGPVYDAYVNAADSLVKLVPLS